ncbi:hypothetical protein AO385_1921 [Moraxella catarrhalis]|nr:hypothetical protein AO385_1921 [Moraxella catarrhalis]
MLSFLQIITSESVDFFCERLRGCKFFVIATDCKNARSA